MKRLQSLIRWALIAAIALATPAAQAMVPVPALSAHVVDQTHTLSDADKARLEQALSALESDRGSQVAVLLVPTTRPEPIEQFALRVAEAWKLGRKKIDDGALLVVAVDDKRLRIEVGYGLEGALSDALTHRIIDQVIVPKFRENDFSGGVSAGVDLMIRAIRGEPLPASLKSASQTPIESWQSLLLIFAIPALGLGLVLRKLFGRLRGSLATGLIAGLISWFFVESLLIVLALSVTIAALSFTGIAGLMMGGRGPGSGSSGGGFRGGGGGFGGGGSSGRW